MAKQDKNIVPEWDDGEYGTGRMQPPKDHTGVIAFLLILVIFLSGVVTMLSIMNIRLFHRLARQEREESPIAFAAEPDCTGRWETMGQAVAECPALGFCGDEVTIFYQTYYALPAGIYVETLISGGPAEQAGIQSGDILTTLNGVPIPTLLDLETALKRAGQSVSVMVYRPSSETEMEIVVCPIFQPEGNQRNEKLPAGEISETHSDMN